ncbi:MAG: hypothetical protein IPM89_09360 [Candidatus Competibacteraceae bacterium]|nr:MAG: hypothetical protein IPM89_09360 [Candidatus Competibacteraceae bacterium]
MVYLESSSSLRQVGLDAHFFFKFRVVGHFASLLIGAHDEVYRLKIAAKEQQGMAKTEAGAGVVAI